MKSAFNLILKHWRC